jgi:hypothetical protein
MDKMKTLSLTKTAPAHYVVEDAPGNWVSVREWAEILGISAEELLIRLEEVGKDLAVNLIIVECKDDKLTPCALDTSGFGVPGIARDAVTEGMLNGFIPADWVTLWSVRSDLKTGVGKRR